VLDLGISERSGRTAAIQGEWVLFPSPAPNSFETPQQVNKLRLGKQWKHLEWVRVPVVVRWVRVLGLAVRSWSGHSWGSKARICAMVVS
jgi:hypothetical protein